MCEGPSSYLCGVQSTFLQSMTLQILFASTASVPRPPCSVLRLTSRMRKLGNIVGTFCKRLSLLPAECMQIGD